jgi:hypothetical protein
MKFSLPARLVRAQRKLWLCGDSSLSIVFLDCIDNSGRNTSHSKIQIKFCQNELS